MKKRASSPMRVDNKTKRAINILAAELQAQRGEPVSADEALWTFIEKHRPDVTERAIALEKGGAGGDIAEPDPRTVAA